MGDQKTKLLGSGFANQWFNSVWQADFSFGLEVEEEMVTPNYFGVVTIKLLLLLDLFISTGNGKV